MILTPDKLWTRADGALEEVKAGKYDREFKLEAIRLSSEEGARAIDVERRLGLSQGIISRWKRQQDDEGADAFLGKGHLSVPDEQVRHLQRENDRLRRERDILKKALAIFSEGRQWIATASFTGTARGGVLGRCAVYGRCLGVGFMPGKMAVFIVLFSRQVVGWALSRSLDHGLVLKALERARQKRKRPRGLMIHSDRLDVVY